MAEIHVTHSAAHWDAAFADFEAAQAAAEVLADHPSGALRDEIVALPALAAQRVIRISAPTLGHVARKLEVYWGEDLFREDIYANDWRQRIIGDLRRIERLQAGLDELDATGGLDLAKAAHDWSEALQEHQRWTKLLLEGPSAAWDGMSSGEVVAIIDEAEAALLSVPALSLNAVIKKLEVLWEDDRFDPVYESSDHLLILRDLRRFALRTKQ